MTKNERLMFGVAVVSAGAAIAAVFYGCEQAQVAREANDRASGRVRANVQVVGILPKPDNFPPELVEKFQNQLDVKSVCFREAGQLVFVNPRIVVKNVGQEPIDTLRVETKFVYGIIDALGKPPEQVRQKDPFVLRQVEREEYTLSRKFKPGETLVIPVTRGLLGQMIQAQNPDKGDWKHSGRFEIRCFGKMVGGTSFDGPDQDSFVQITYWWYPNGFAEDKCKAIIEKMQPEPKPEGK